MAIKRYKITVVGAGFTGAHTALMLAQNELGNVVLLDIPQLENPTKGKALDKAALDKSAESVRSVTSVVNV
ncbi:lactate/malate dehydrogenase, NAD binding domain [Paenibacillus sophorae]|uniref:Lactate/malate dehydrogenase, NAD binding domain n=1 Tax=Paenibacillus sophorae TaxID=1333845 RepID=A0A1H8MK33_9BACL|nr:hypothetical protein [Paenibacillus sophorae]SEO17772.1 lactate/malate dehydrogenase, NAD binding domain [Paenibacillus sophorae]